MWACQSLKHVAPRVLTEILNGPNVVVTDIEGIQLL